MVTNITMDDMQVDESDDPNEEIIESVCEVELSDSQLKKLCLDVPCSVDMTRRNVYWRYEQNIIRLLKKKNVTIKERSYTYAHEKFQRKFDFWYNKQMRWEAKFQENRDTAQKYRKAESVIYLESKFFSNFEKKYTSWKRRQEHQSLQSPGERTEQRDHVTNSEEDRATNMEEDQAISHLEKRPAANGNVNFDYLFINNNLDDVDTESQEDRLDENSEHLPTSNTDIGTSNSSNDPDEVGTHRLHPDRIVSEQPHSENIQNVGSETYSEFSSGVQFWSQHATSTQQADPLI